MAFIFHFVKWGATKGTVARYCCHVASRTPAMDMHLTIKVTHYYQQFIWLKLGSVQYGNDFNALVIIMHYIAAHMKDTWYRLVQQVQGSKWHKFWYFLLPTMCAMQLLIVAVYLQLVSWQYIAVCCSATQIFSMNLIITDTSWQIRSKISNRKKT